MCFLHTQQVIVKNLNMLPRISKAQECTYKYPLKSDGRRKYSPIQPKFLDSQCLGNHQRAAPQNLRKNTNNLTIGASMKTVMRSPRGRQRETNYNAKSAVKAIHRLRRYFATSNTTVTRITSARSTASTAINSTCRQELLKCTSERIHFPVNAKFVGRRLADLGFFKDILEPTRVKNLTNVQTVRELSLIDRTYGRIFKLIQRSRNTAAVCAPNLSQGCPCC